MPLSDGTVTLRAPEKGDAAFIYDMENDPRLWECGDNTLPLQRSQIERYIATYTGSIATGEDVRFVIVLADGTRVGMIDLFDISLLHRRAGVGIAVAEPWRRRGIALRALTLLCGYARTRLNMYQLWAHVGADNSASRALFAAAGFRTTGVLRGWTMRDGRPHDAYYLARLLR